MTVHAHRPITALAAAFMAVAILTVGALAQADPLSPAELAKYGWGAAATYAKAQKATAPVSVRVSETTMPTQAELAKYGWGAAATYAKAMKAQRGLKSTAASLPGGLTQAELAKYGWGAAATYAKAMKAQPARRTG